MTAEKQIWILAGGNGSGKSTFYRLFLSPVGIHFINADRIASDIEGENPENISYKAAVLTEQIRDKLLANGISFCYETVFSHRSKIDFVAKAKALGYKIILIYFHLKNQELNEARVLQRVSEGGHNVPRDKIYERLPRVLKNIKSVLPIADEVRLLDNSSWENPFLQIAVIKQGEILKLKDPLPEWVKQILGK